MPDNNKDQNHGRIGPAGPSQQNPAAIHTPKLTRVVGLIRGFTGLVGVVSLTVLTAEAALPASYKPSMLIGSFHGRIEAADAAAKLDATAALARRHAEATAQPPAFATMESDAFRQQQQVLADALQTQSTVANAESRVAGRHR